MTDKNKNTRDPVESLRNLIDEWGLTDAVNEYIEENTGQEWDEEIVPPTFAEHAKAQWRTAEAFSAWKEAILSAGEDGQIEGELVSSLPLWQGPPKSFRTNYEVSLKMAADSSGIKKNEGPVPEPPCTYVAEGKLHSLQRINDVPFCLVRVVAVDKGKPFHTIIMPMTPDKELWKLELLLEVFFNYNLPDGQPEYYVVPATEENLDWFPVPSVRAIAEDQNMMPFQSDRLKQLLHLLESNTNEESHE